MAQFDDAKVYGPGSPQSEEIMQVETGLAMNAGSLEALTRGEIDQQIATAHKYPRSIKRFLEETRSMALIDEETAESCFYKIPRGGKNIEGPSIRLMEIAASAWGNIRYGSRTIGEDSEFVTSQGVAHDLERNVAVSIEVKRRITGKNGRRYDADMIGVTANAGGSIARRNALLGIIPRAYINNIFEEAKRVAVGTQQTLADKRANAIAYFGKMGVTPERVYARLTTEEEPVRGIEDVTLAHLELLIGLKTAIKENEITLDTAFPVDSQPKITGSVKAFEKKETETVVESTQTVSAEESKPEPEQEVKAEAASTEPAGKRAYTIGYGVYQNVYLTIKEVNAFVEQYGKDAVDEMIHEFGTAIKEKGLESQYKNHQKTLAASFAKKYPPAEGAQAGLGL